MGIKQCIKNILSFGASNDAVSMDDVVERIVSHQTTYHPEVKPAISELAQQLAEAIRTGKILLVPCEEQDMFMTKFKPIGELNFWSTLSGIQCNNLFNVAEQALFHQAHKEWKNKLAQEQLNKSAQQLKNLLSSLDK